MDRLSGSGNAGAQATQQRRTDGFGTDWTAPARLAVRSPELERQGVLLACRGAQTANAPPSALPGRAPQLLERPNDELALLFSPLLSEVLPFLPRGTRARLQEVCKLMKASVEAFNHRLRQLDCLSMDCADARVFSTDNVIPALRTLADRYEAAWTNEGRHRAAGPRSHNALEAGYGEEAQGLGRSLAKAYGQLVLQDSPHYNSAHRFLRAMLAGACQSSWLQSLEIHKWDDDIEFFTNVQVILMAAELRVHGGLPPLPISARIGHNPMPEKLLAALADSTHVHLLSLSVDIGSASLASLLQALTAARHLCSLSVSASYEYSPATAGPGGEPPMYPAWKKFLEGHPHLNALDITRGPPVPLSAVLVEKLSLHQIRIADEDPGELESAIASSTRLQQLDIYHVIQDRAPLDTVMRGIVANTSIRTLKLGGVLAATDSELLNELMNGLSNRPRPLKALSLVGMPCIFPSPWVERISLFMVQLMPEEPGRLDEKLACSTVLKVLVLRDLKSARLVVKPLLKAIAQNRSIEHLELRGSWLSKHPKKLLQLFEALRTHPTLNTLIVNDYRNDRITQGLEQLAQHFPRPLHINGLLFLPGQQQAAE